MARMETLLIRIILTIVDLVLAFMLTDVALLTAFSLSIAIPVKLRVET